MTRQETTKVLAAITAVYPAFLKDRDPALTVNIWTSVFEDESYEQVSRALTAFISTDTKGFPPMPGNLKKLINEMQPERRELSEMGIWAAVHKAICNSMYNSEYEFNRLPKIAQRIVGSPSQLKAWAMMDEEEIETVVSSNFLRSLRGAQEREDKFSLLPPSIRPPEVVEIRLTSRQEEPKLIPMFTSNDAGDPCEPDEARKYVECLMRSLGWGKE